MTPIGFIGAGRVARGLGAALDAAGYGIRHLASRSPASAERLATTFPNCTAVSTQAVVDGCETVFVTTPDDEIAPVAGALRWRAGQAALHCSGATEISALAPAAEAGAMIGGFHPLQSFGEGGASLAGVTVTIEADPPLSERLERMAHALGCRANRLPPGKRALYHASAGYGSQFLNVLRAEIAAIWGAWGASEEDVLAAVLPMARATLDGIERNGIAASMPGPVSRGDTGSVAGHLAAFGDDADRRDFYRAHCLRSVDLALEAGRIDRVTAERLRALLDAE